MVSIWTRLNSCMKIELKKIRVSKKMATTKKFSRDEYRKAFKKALRICVKKSDAREKRLKKK